MSIPVCKATAFSLVTNIMCYAYITVKLSVNVAAVIKIKNKGHNINSSGLCTLRFPLPAEVPKSAIYWMSDFLLPISSFIYLWFI